MSDQNKVVYVDFQNRKLATEEKNEIQSRIARIKESIKRIDKLIAELRKGKDDENK